MLSQDATGHSVLRNSQIRVGLFSLCSYLGNERQHTWLPPVPSKNATANARG